MNNINSLRTSMRFSGMATGLDTESMVKDLMKVERFKVDKLKQERQLVEWRRDSYRGVIDKIRELKSSFLDVLKPASNMLSRATYREFSVESSNSSAVTAAATAEARDSSITINSITRLATAANTSSSTSISAPLKGAPVFTDLDPVGDPAGDLIELTGKTLTLAVDGVSRTISFDRNYASLTDLRDDLTRHFDSAFGLGRLSASVNGSELSIDAPGSTVTVSLGDALTALGLTAGQSNRVSQHGALARAGLNSTPTASTFAINGVSFTFDPAVDSLTTIINTVNRSSANVLMSYSNVTDKVTLTAKNTGAGPNIVITETSGTLLSSLGLTAGTTSNGQDAVFQYNGTTITRPTNSVSLDGVNFTLRTETSTPTTIKIAQDILPAFENIKTFVEKYNELIDSINAKLTEKRYSDYQPLTEEQRKELSDEEVKMWDEKAKSGLLRNEPILSKMLTDMRRAFSDAVGGAQIRLDTIGITTGSYSDRGRLRIDESKLKEALRTRGDEVAELFTAAADKAYSPHLTSLERSTRYSQAGLAHRLSDIIEDNTRIIRDRNGKKGLLLEKAGIKGDATEFKNSLEDEIARINARIDRANETLVRKEDRYWRQFTALEKAISRMNSQSEWLAQQFAPRG